MSKITSRELADLEALIDRHDLSAVLDSIASICREKAEHLRANWQDHEAAKLWDSAGNSAEQCSINCEDVS